MKPTFHMLNLTKCRKSGVVPVQGYNVFYVNLFITLLLTSCLGHYKPHILKQVRETNCTMYVVANKIINKLPKKKQTLIEGMQQRKTVDKIWIFQAPINQINENI